MKLGWIVCFALVITQLLSAQSESEKKTAEDSHLLGYSAQTSQQQKDSEKKFRDGIVPDNIRENMRRLSARPHHVGSPYDKDNAEWILSKFKEYGFDAHIETFSVLFPTPKERVVELLEPQPNSPRNCRSPHWRSIPLQTRLLNSYRHITLIPSTAMLPRRSCM
jgi:hypothetical protein